MMYTELSPAAPPLQPSRTAPQVRPAPVTSSGDSAAYLSQALKLIPDAVSISRIRDGMIVDVNDRWPDVFGYSREEAIGALAANLNVWYDLEDRAKIHRLLAQHGTLRDYESIARRKSGELRQVSFSAELILCAGEPHALAVVRDITDHKRSIAALEESRRTLAGVISTASDAIITTDAEGSVVIFNAAAERMFRCTAADVLGKKLLHFFPERFRMAAMTYMMNFATNVQIGERMNMPAETAFAVRADGEEFPFEINMSKSEEGGRPLYTVIMRDMSEQRAAEALLQAKESAEQASKEKSEFLSRVSHELRTPLNAILGFAQLLALETLDDKQRESVGYITTAGKHLLALINEVLDISRIESGRLTLSSEPLSVQDVLCEAVDMISPTAAARDVAVTLPASHDDEDYVMGDYKRLLQVLLNLLSNAVKYNWRGGDVSISLQHRGANRLRVLVADSGPGIPEAKLPRLFVPFDRLGAESSGVDGTGLGLVLSRSLVEAMGGSIGVESRPGRGTTFWIELGLIANPNLAAPVYEPASPSDPGPCTILYVEDNPSNLRLMRAVVGEYPAITLLHASSGAASLDIVRQQPPDLILLDLHLPDMSGQEVLRRLRTDHASATIPVVVLSADALPDQIATLRSAGATDYITKPFEVDRLIDLIARLTSPTR